MKYRLALLTHGDNGSMMPRTVKSFYEHVEPLPIDLVCVIDACDDTSVLPPIIDRQWRTHIVSEQLGFCGATGLLWQLAAEVRDKDVDYVFWLEQDFVFARDIDLTELAETLEENPQVAQISFMRNPVNNNERQHGGVVAAHRAAGGEFQEHQDWLEHTAYFTTNPSLTKRSFLAGHTWREGPECEGKTGSDLREAGMTFGIWGHGEQWIEHIGTRVGHGY